MSTLQNFLLESEWCEKVCAMVSIGNLVPWLHIKELLYWPSNHNHSQSRKQISITQGQLEP